MSYVPRWFYRIRIFNNHYKYFNDLYEMHDDLDALEDKQIQEIFNNLKTCYVFYNRAVKDILNAWGIDSLLPSKVFAIAENQGIINDSEVWLNYIQELNEFYLTYGNGELRRLAIQILRKYQPRLQNASDNLNRYIASHACIIEYEYAALSEDTKPLYSHLEIGFSEYSYKIFLDYLISNKNIKYAWLHGSRVKGNARKYSDMDLIIDIDMEFVEACRKDFANLLIPYKIDFVSRHDKSMEVFLGEVIPHAKLIYRAEDFE